jgi:uncharacterized protein YndB with AHSA1/START domain
MTTKPFSTENSAAREIVVARVFDAPRELVWRAISEPQHVAQWWGPRGFSTTIEKMEFRVGGEWKHLMRGPDGAEFPNKSVFQEIVPHERIVYLHGGHRQGGPGTSFVATWTFDALAPGRTRVTMRLVFASPDERDFVVKEFGALEGGRQTLERLAELLPKLTARPGEFVLARTFAAPRALVWEAWTQREQLMAWFGPKGFKIPSAKLDLRVGGIFHYCMEARDGSKLWGRWIFREIVAPERIVWVNSFADEAGGLARVPFSDDWPSEMLSVATFIEHEGRTTITLRSTALNATAGEQQTFDQNHDSMRGGWTGTFDQLDAFLAAGSRPAS